MEQQQLIGFSLANLIIKFHAGLISDLAESNSIRIY